MNRRFVLVEILIIILVGLLGATLKVHKVGASETIYIRASGSVEPPWTPISTVDNVTYTFTDNINASIVVERDNIILNGASYTLQGTGADESKGIYLEGIKNVTIRNIAIRAFDYGILFSASSNNSITGNNIAENKFLGIQLSSSSNNSVYENNITENDSYGIELDQSSTYNNIYENNITNSQFCVALYGSSYNNIVKNNITNSGFGILLANSSNHTSIVENNITRGHGIELDWSSYNSIVGNTFVNDGLYVWDSYGNMVERNVVNNKPLVYLEGMSNNTIDEAGQVILVNCDNIRVENLNLSNTSAGLELWRTNNTMIGNNSMTSNIFGISLAGSSNNSIFGNNIMNNYIGIYLFESANNNVIGNVIKENERGIWLYYLSSNNEIYHNNFIDNYQQVYSNNLTNIWDDGYPSGGNYWSDYSDVDQYSGPYQNNTGSDEIWDHQYVIDENNKDNYPIVPEFPSVLILPLFMITTLPAVIVYKRKHFQ
jgi:parallel beta-helix repeat protein